MPTFEGEHTFSNKEMIAALEKLPISDVRNNIINNLEYSDSPYMVRLSSYNQLLESVGKEPLHLEKNEVVLYEDPELRDEESIGILEEALKTGVRLQIDGQDYLMKEKVMSYDVVTDNKITLMDGLIVEDSVFDALHQEGNTECYWNAVLDSKIIEKEGLIKSFTDINKELTKTGIDYESYMENMGRYLFYMVSETYLAVYMGVIFLIIL